MDMFLTHHIKITSFFLSKFHFLRGFAICRQKPHTDQNSQTSTIAGAQTGAETSESSLEVDLAAVEEVLIAKVLFEAPLRRTDVTCMIGNDERETMIRSFRLGCQNTFGLAVTCFLCFAFFLGLCRVLAVDLLYSCLYAKANNNKH